MIEIRQSKTADTRSCDYANVSEDTLYNSSIQHIGDVRKGLAFFGSKLDEAAIVHDEDKLTDIKGFHADFVTGFKHTGWWDRHRQLNRHHLLQADGVRDDVNLIDVLDMIADCVMAGMARTGSVYPLNIDQDVLRRAFDNTVELLKSQVRVKADERRQVPDLLADNARLRADGATLPPKEWLRAFDELLRQHGIPDGLIVRDFTAWAARVMKGARVGMDEALSAHAASFGALATLSAALFDGEVDNYAVLAEKIIARVTQAEADVATLRERVRKLSSPIRQYMDLVEIRYLCSWCSECWQGTSTHPDNGCLWSEVHQPASARKEPTP